jgi:hypothetical protein
VIRADAAATDAGPVLTMLAAAFDMSTTASPDLWRRYLALLLDGLRATDRQPMPVPPPVLEKLDDVTGAGKRRGTGG